MLSAICFRSIYHKFLASLDVKKAGMLIGNSLSDAQVLNDRSGY